MTDPRTCGTCLWVRLGGVGRGFCELHGRPVATDDPDCGDHVLDGEGVTDDE